MLRENIEHNLTRIDEDLVDILVDLSKTNSVLNTDINEGLNVFNVGEKSLNFRQRQKKIRLICLMITLCLKKIQKPTVLLQKMVV